MLVKGHSQRLTIGQDKFYASAALHVISDMSDLPVLAPGCKGGRFFDWRASGFAYRRDECLWANDLYSGLRLQESTMNSLPANQQIAYVLCVTVKEAKTYAVKCRALDIQGGWGLIFSANAPNETMKKLQPTKTLGVYGLNG